MEGKERRQDTTVAAMDDLNAKVRSWVLVRIVRVSLGRSTKAFQGGLGAVTGIPHPIGDTGCPGSDADD